MVRKKGDFMEFEIRGEKYVIKPYLCSPSNKFPFYINITNICNAKCEFCCNAHNKSFEKLDLNYLKEALDVVSNNVSRIAISGGEPMINSKDLEDLLNIVDSYGVPITINTNGSFLMKNVDLLNKYKNIESIQLSRHHYDDNLNNEIFKIKTIGIYEVNELNINPLIGINCLLIKGYIDSFEEVIKYLEFIADETTLAQVGFISMMKVNEYTENKFVDYREIISFLGEKFSKVSSSLDGERCSCVNYIYTSQKGEKLFVYFKYTKEYGCSGRSLFFDCSGLKIGY